MPDEHPCAVLMLGTFGLQPKATLRARALAMAQSLASPHRRFSLVTTPWDHPQDAGRRWTEDGTTVINTRATHPLTFPLATSEMIRYARTFQPNVIHLFKPKGFGDVAARWLRRRTPVVVDMDDWEGDGGWNDIGDYRWPERRIFDWQERSWPRQAAALTVASRELERRAISLGADPSRILYVPNGLTRERFDLLASAPTRDERHGQRSSPTDGPVILLYTRFVEFEPALVVQVLATVRRAFPSASVLIVGGSASGAAERSVHDAARAAGLDDAIQWHGWADPDDIPRLAAGCDVAIHPFDDNLVNRSKCSVKLLELMATGLPIVTTEVGENAHFIQHGASGLLAPPGEPDALARAVIHLLEQRDVAQRLGRAARERVRHEFLWEHLAARVEGAYRMAFDRRPASAAS